MRDVLLTYDNDILDLDIVDGEPRYVQYAENTDDQRAAVGAYMSKGTIPGMLEQGINWMDLYAKKSSLIDVDNQTKQQMSSFASSESGTSGYTPIYIKEKGQMKIVVVRG